MIVKRGEGNDRGVYRPCRISEVYGQDDIKKVIADGLDNGTLDQVLLFHGVSGTGKTTFGRIVAMGLNCKKGSTSEPCCECEFCKAVLNGCSFAFQEFDAGHLSGVDDMRKERQNFAAAPISYDRKKIILFDECHRLSKEAQHALLKPTEDVYSHIQFIFCTTSPEIMIPTLQNRCMPFEFRELQPEEIKQRLIDVCKCEGLDSNPDILDIIIREAEGMPRNALTQLQKAVASGNLKPIIAGCSGMPRQEGEKTLEVYDVEQLF